MSVEPALAAVRPRVYVEKDRCVNIEQAIRICRSWDVQAIRLLGPSGAGKTSALQHLAARHANDDSIQVAEHPLAHEVLEALQRGILIYTAPESMVDKQHMSITLAPWSLDDVIDFVLHNYRDHCQRIMSCVRDDPDFTRIAGHPRTWAQIVGSLENNPQLRTVREALQYLINEHIGYSHERTKLAEQAWRVSAYADGDTEIDLIGQHRGIIRQLLEQEFVRCLLGSEFACGALIKGNLSDVLAQELSLDMRLELANKVQHRPDLVDVLQRCSGWRYRKLLPTAATLLCAAGIDWRPSSRVTTLERAILHDVKWSKIQLGRVNLRGAALLRADLRHADLSSSNLQHATLREADLSHAILRSANLLSANLTEAQLEHIDAQDASFSNANLSYCDIRHSVLTGARFVEADLTNANFMHSNISLANFQQSIVQDANFSNCVLDYAKLGGIDMRCARFAGASFKNATLLGCRLDAMELPSSDFEAADLRMSDLSATFMPSSNFAHANLRSCGLADIEWERANLQHADLRGASFHMGSARSGTLDSPIASEGTRTGYYTDDYYEQEFKAPEEIRKANLRGADLRGAIINDVDFYLVDLRDALYDVDQEQHFRSCGAILESRVDLP